MNILEAEVICYSLKLTSIRPADSFQIDPVSLCCTLYKDMLTFI